MPINNMVPPNSKAVKRSIYFFKSDMPVTARVCSFRYSRSYPLNIA